MGIIWKSAMPLLSTLAALVIIVHSAEEDRESEYRRNLEPRIIDSSTPSYEQPWRVMNIEPVMIKSTESNTWNNNSPEEPPKRRRPGRKRKRRPQTSLTEGLVSEETNIYPESQQTIFEEDLTNSEHAAEIPKRRRKKLESRPDIWTDVAIQRPFKRRGQRRKRPVVKTWPELSEFNGFDNDEKIPITTASSEQKDIGNSNQNDDSTQYLTNKRKDNTGELLENDPLTRETENPTNEQSKDQFNLVIKGKESHAIQHRGPYLQEDKSLSEFSFEEMHLADEPKKNYEPETLQGKLKSTGVFNEYDRAQSNDPVDPITLKDILRKSNGTSLSEILQLHNLSLEDLLHGKENAISILKSEGSVKITNNVPINQADTDISKDLVENGSEEKLLVHLETKNTRDPVDEFATTTQSTRTTQEEQVYKKDDVESTTIKQENNTYNNTYTYTAIRRYPPAARRKLRMRPMVNSTHKSPLSRDFIALSARKYLHHRRNSSKPIEWRNVIPSVINISTPESDKKEDIEISTVSITTIEQLTIQSDDHNKNQTVILKPDNNKRFDMDEVMDELLSTTSIKPDETSKNLVTDNPGFISTIKPLPISPGLRRYTFNNRLKKKRLRQKNSTTESPQIKIVKHPLKIENLPLSTEFVVRTQAPKMKQEDKDYVTALEDFMTTQNPTNLETKLKSATFLSISSMTTSKPPTTRRIGEKSAKIEIDEIFNDIQTSARLSKILMERNMTLSELVEHRERGSSHIHLADIFHNTSKEPNPPEPFLSKSVIEPISKETYPLRAILEANAHDATNKPSINDLRILETSYINIPVVMDFGNNVNENAENMGIMSLFNNFTKNDPMKRSNNLLQKGSEGRTYKTDITAINTTQLSKIVPTVRESRVLTDSNNQDDVVSWNEIFSLMRRNYKNETKDLFESIQNEPSLLQTPQTITIEDKDGDGLIALEDLQGLKNFDINVVSDTNEKLDVDSLERPDSPPGIYEKIPSQTKSVTVATASIAGFAMVLFLLTYAVFRWKQRRVVPGKTNSVCSERIPTPVFENRKGHKNNSSTRSISPMLSTSNIYTLNTLDSRNGKDSPEYMWDSLRKPFQ